MRLLCYYVIIGCVVCYECVIIVLSLWCCYSIIVWLLCWYYDVIIVILLCVYCVVSVWLLIDQCVVIVWVLYDWNVIYVLLVCDYHTIIVWLLCLLCITARLFYGYCVSSVWILRYCHASIGCSWCHAVIIMLLLCNYCGIIMLWLCGYDIIIMLLLWLVCRYNVIAMRVLC